jgi:hypothetical protein
MPWEDATSQQRTNRSGAARDDVGYSAFYIVVADPEAHQTGLPLPADGFEDVDLIGVALVDASAADAADPECWRPALVLTFLHEAIDDAAMSIVQSLLSWCRTVTRGAPRRGRP